MLFHANRAGMNPGDVIAPGNYGRIILDTGLSHPSWRREIVLEAVRLEFYPAKPSRLASCFACTTERTARFYRDNRAKGDHLFIVEKVDPDAIEHRADFNVIQPLARYQAGMWDIAHHYWRSDLWITIQDHEDVRCEEVLTPSPLRVLQRMD